jgi:hypothetical protein
MRVAICGDGFRVHARRDNADYTFSVRILERLIGPALQSAGASFDTFGGFYSDPKTRLALQRALGEERDVETWMLRSQVRSASLDDFFDVAFQGYDIIVGFEICPTLIQFCEDRGKKVLDFAIHPYRFLPDLVMMARSPNVEVQESLNAIECFVNDFPRFIPFSKDSIGRIEKSVGALRSQLGSGSKSIFYIQTRFDRSKFDGKGSYIDDLALVRRAGISPTLYKPHPSEPRPEIELELRKRGAVRVAPDWNFYDLVMAFPEIECISVSSSTLAEAEALGVRRVSMLAGTPWAIKGLERFSSPSSSSVNLAYIPIDLRFTSVNFWKAVLGIGGFSRSVTVGFQPDVLRAAWGQRWDFKKQ